MPEAMENYARNPYLFIVGCARSGTTLLQRIVDAHPLIAIIHELHWVTSYFKQQKVRRPEDRVTPELVAGLLENHRFARLRIAREDVKGLVGSGESIPYVKFLTCIFELYRLANGKPLVGNKTPAYVRHLSALHTLWPQAKFIHLIRDGRDVCLSAMSWSRADVTVGRFVTWGADPVSTTALWWKRKVVLGQEGGRSVGSGLYREIRYESLVAQPTDECEALCEFLDLPYDDAMLRFAEGRSGVDPVDPDHPWMPLTSGIRDWRSQMPEADIERFEAVAGDLLEELGYERAFPSPSAETLEHVSNIRETFTQDLRTRGQSLPEGW